MTHRNTIYGKVIKVQLLLNDTEDIFVQDKHIYPEKTLDSFPRTPSAYLRATTTKVKDHM